MRKHFVCLLITVLVLLSTLFPTASFAEDETSPPPVSQDDSAETTEPVTVPFITKIEFYGATFPSEFKSDVFEHTVNISSHEEFALKSFSCSDYNAEMKIDYISNKNGSTKGVIVTVKNVAGSNDYKFYFDTVQTLPKTSDTSLIGINFNYGELYPNFRSNVFKYTLYLPSDLEVLVLDPITSDENATINTPSQISLKKDQNTPISIKVTASDGTSTGVYKLTIKRVDKTIGDIKKLMEEPDFKTFVEIPFYNQASFYIITAGCIFAIVLITVILLSLRKNKKQPLPTDIQIIMPSGSTFVPPTMLSTNDIPESIPVNNIVTLTEDIQEKLPPPEKLAEPPVKETVPLVSEKQAKKLEKAKAKALKKSKLEAEAKAKALAQAKLEEETKAKTLEQAKLEEETKAKALAQAKLEEEAKAKALAQAKLEEEAKAKALAQAKLEEETKAKALEQAKLEEETKAKALEQAKLEEEAKAKALVQAKLEEETKTKALEQAKLEEEAKAKALEQAKLEEETKAKALAQTKIEEALIQSDENWLELDKYDKYK